MWSFWLILNLLTLSMSIHWISSVLHIILISYGQRGSTLLPASADSLSELISELERTYDWNVFMVLRGGILLRRYVTVASEHLGGFQNIFRRCLILKPAGNEIFYVLFLLFAVICHENTGIVYVTFSNCRVLLFRRFQGCLRSHKTPVTAGSLLTVSLIQSALLCCGDWWSQNQLLS